MKYPEFAKYTTGMYPEQSTIYVFPAYDVSDLFCIRVINDPSEVGKFRCDAFQDDKPIDIPKDAVVREVVMHNLSPILHVMRQIKIPRCIAYYDRKSKKFVEFIDNLNRFISPGFAIDLFDNVLGLLKPTEIVVITKPTDLDKFTNVIFKPAPMAKAFGSDKLTYSRK